jgi:hypothetical protein
MLTSIGTEILNFLGVVLYTAILGPFGVLFSVVGVGSAGGIFEYVGKQQGVYRLPLALILGPVAAGFALVGVGIGLACFLPLASFLFDWYAPPQIVPQLNSWLSGSAFTTATTHVAAIALWLWFGSFVLGISLGCLLGIPEMVRKLHSFFDFIAVLFALGLGLTFLWVFLEFVFWIFTGTTSLPA